MSGWRADGAAENAGFVELTFGGTAIDHGEETHVASGVGRGGHRRGAGGHAPMDVAHVAGHPGGFRPGTACMDRGQLLRHRTPAPAEREQARLLGSVRTALHLTLEFGSRD